MRTLTLKPYLAVILSLAWSIACVQAQFTFDHVGSGATGSLTPNAEPGSYTLEGGGDDIWSASDNFDYAHYAQSGDFDVRVRVESLEFTAIWTKAGIMARETLAPNSRMAFNRVTPSQGANDTRFAYRTGTTSGAQGEHEDGSGAPQYPNGWLRLVRAGNVFNAYASSDGLNWRLQGTQDTAGWEGGAIAANLELGLAVARHSGADTLATCEFRDAADAAASPAAVSTQPASQTVEEGFSATFRFSAVGGFDLYDIQWRKNGVDIAGANGITYTTPPLAVTDSGSAYSVAIRQKNNATTATSADAIVTVVPDTTAPALVSAAATPGIASAFNVVFSEPVNESDAENLANYSVTGATLSSAELQADNQTVRIGSSALNAPGCRVLTVNNIRDRAGIPNMIAANSMTGVVYADGSVRYRQYNGIGGVDIPPFTSNPRYPNSPDRTVYHNLLENPEGGGNHFDNYGALIDGLITAPVTGAYTFYIAADDHAEFWLSTDENPANKVLIASEPNWAGFREYTGNAGGRRPCALEGGRCENVSAPVTLAAGCRYAFQFLYKEGGGGDYGSVAWQTPAGGPQPGIPANGSAPIGATYLSPLTTVAVTLAADQPADQSISENQPLNLSINITAGTPAFHIQWYKDGAAIPGATGTSYSVANAQASDAGTYYATVQNGAGTTASRSAIVAVSTDFVAPSLVSAQAPAGNGTQFDAVFSEPVNEADAENVANYDLPGVTLNSATLQADNRTVRFTSSSLYGDGCRILTANNIRDRAIPPNTAMGTMAGVVAAKGSIRYHQYNGIGGTSVGNLTSHPKYPNFPDRIVNVTEFENPDGGGDNLNDYGADFVGFVHPPISGDYRFYIASDDMSRLWVSTDENPANKVLMATEPNWSGYRAYTGGGGGGGGRVCPGVTTCNISPPITLQAGCKYYIQYIYKEGGGGDYGSVAWQLPGGSPPANGSAPIQAAYISPYEVPATIPDGQPADLTVIEGRFATFSANISGSPSLLVQWYRDGVAIAGANGFSYTLGPARYPGDNGATFYVTASNSLAQVQSRTATLTVVEDNDPPQLIAAAGSTTFDRVTATYNEIVADQSAGDEFNYTVSDGVNSLVVVAADLQPDGKTVVLRLDAGTPLQLDTTYTVTANNIFDIADPGNEMVTGSASFHTPVEGCGGLIFEVYNTGGGTAIDLLLNHPSFPNNPVETRRMTAFDTVQQLGTANYLDNYGARIRGVYVPPQSGNWVFYMGSDDASRLYFNPNGTDPAGKILIAQELGCCQNYGAIRSAAFPLTGGHPYYIEGIYKEGGGNDNMAVIAKLEGEAPPNCAAFTACADSIAERDLGKYAAPGSGGTLTLQGPADQNVLENRTATFSVNAESSLGLPVCYQWYRDGIAIAGATSSSYSLRATLSDNGAVFYVRASIVGSVVDSAAATLTVIPDTAGPRVLSALGSDTFRNVTVHFDELLGAGAADPFNYAIPGLTVDGAVLLANGQSVRLTTSEQTPGTIYTVTVTGVQDASAAGNVVDSAYDTANFTAFTLSCGLLVFDAYNNIGGTAVSDLTSNPNYPDRPDETRYMNTFDTAAALGTTDYRNNFGARVHGVFIPPASGNWIFYLRSDDASQLHLNPLGIDPAGKVLLTEELGCCGPFAAHASAPVPLVAGQHYFIEGIYKEGGGGDYIQVAAKLDTDPTPPNSLRGIGAGSLGIYADQSGAQIAITEQPASQTVCLNPLATTQPAASFTVAASAAPEGTVLKSEDFNSGDGGFTVQTDTPFEGPWMYDGTAGVWHADGQAAELGAPMTSRLTSPAITVNQAGVVRLTFSHRWSLEPGWDGGQVKVSINGGPYNTVPGSAFTEGAYNGTVFGNSASVAHGESAYINESPGHGAGDRVQSTAVLGTMNAGDTVSIQFLYAADTNTKGNNPNWEIDSLTLKEGGGAAQPVFVQWQRNNGSGWADIPGATARTYSFNPTLADNGAQFRALLSSPGATCATSSEATLTVIQMNTPPAFDLGSNQAATEDDGSHGVPGFASNIKVHSIPRNTTLTFDTLPPNSELYGVAVITGGTCHLTDFQPGAFGALVLNLGSVQTFNTFEVSWKSRVGGSTDGASQFGRFGADGYSFSVGTDLNYPPTYGNPGEEGTGSGLQVAVDTFDNGGGEAPALDIKWAGAQVALDTIDADPGAAKDFLRKDMFVDASVKVTPAGVATFTYDGRTLTATLPGYAGIIADRMMFGARTGGAYDHQWIDSLTGNEWIENFLRDTASAENGQHVSFIVSNDNPALFSQQPAISPDGTLTYALAPNACGDAIVTVVAQDDGGTACNGDDTSDPKTFTIHVDCTPDCPTASEQPIIAFSGEPKAITLSGTDPDGDALTASVASNPQHGSLSVVNGVLTYTSTAGYLGPDSFTFTVNDGTCTSPPATVNITVIPNPNIPPTCVAGVAPAECGVILPNSGRIYTIAIDGNSACLALSSAGTTDPDSESLSITWVIDGTNVVSGAIVTQCLAVGCHTITMTANDGEGGQCQTTLEVCVITPSEAVEQLIALVEGTTVERRNKRPLIVSLKAAKAAFERDSLEVGAQMIQVFRYKVAAQIASSNPGEAATFDAAAADVIEALECAVNVPPRNDE